MPHAWQPATLPEVPYARSPSNTSGRRRGRPRGPGILGMRSTIAIASCESCTLAGVMWTTSGMPCAPVRMCRLQPFFPRSVGFGPVCPPQNGPHRRTVDHYEGGVDLSCLSEALDQSFVDARPHVRPHPFVQTTPARHHASAAQFCRNHPPRYAGPQDVHHPNQARGCRGLPALLLLIFLDADRQRLYHRWYIGHMKSEELVEYSNHKVGYSNKRAVGFSPHFSRRR